MHPLIGIAGFIAVAAVTPGPNNLVVMRAAARYGLAGTLPAIAGVVVGGLVLLVLVMAGVGSLFARMPGLQVAVTAGGCAYLAWLGASLVIQSLRSNDTDIAAAPLPMPAGFAGLFVFQFLNPKGWVMVLTAVAAVSAHAAAGYAPLVMAFTFIPLVCLAFWALLGRQLRRCLRRRRIRVWFDRAMGALLIGSAILLLIET